MTTRTEAHALLNLKPGEVYAGLVIGADDVTFHHLILLPGQLERATFEQAGTWAKAQGGDLPTRREQSVLFGNCKEEFKSAWYWSGEQCAADDVCAWMQDFINGYQSYNHKGYGYRVRAVRRLPIQ